MSGKIVPLALLFMLLAGCDQQDGEATGEAAVWLSEDGIIWTRVFHPALGGSGEQQMTGLTRFGEGLVAVGSQRQGGVVDGRVWVSADGWEWDVVAPPSMSGPGDHGVWRVSDTPVGLVAVGWVEVDGEVDGAVWLSSDGIDWARSDHPNLGGQGKQLLLAVTVLGSQVVVAGSDDERPVVWTSEDGLTWSTRLILDSAADEGWVAALTPSGPGLVAAGADGTDAGVWLSPDGSGWTRVDDQPALGGDGEQHITGMVSTEHGLVAVGGSGVYERIYFLGRGAEIRTEAAVWFSPDGLTWTRVDDPLALSGVGDRMMYGVTTWGSTIVAVGIESADPREGAVAEAGFDTGFDFDAAIWTSDDRLNWTRVRSQALGGFDWQDIFAVVAFDDLLVAVGGDDYGDGPG